MESMRVLERMKKWQQAMREAAQNYGTEPQPPAPKAPTVPRFAYDQAKINPVFGPKVKPASPAKYGDYTVQQVANIITNESRSLTGPMAREAKYSMARAIMNGQFNPRLFKDTAQATAPRNLRGDEIGRAQENLEIARQAFLDAKMGKPDPVEGNSAFNFRRDNGTAAHAVWRYPFFTNFPLQDVNPRPAQGKNPYLVIYDNKDYDTGKKQLPRGPARRSRR